MLIGVGLQVADGLPGRIYGVKFSIAQVEFSCFHFSYVEHVVYESHQSVAFDTTHGG